MATAFNPQYVNLDRYEAAQIARRANQVSPLDAALQGLNQGVQLVQLPQQIQDQQLQRQLNNALLSQKLTDLQNPNAALARKLTEELTLKGALNPELGIMQAPSGTIGQTIATPQAIPQTSIGLEQALTANPSMPIPTAAPTLPIVPLGVGNVQTGLSQDLNVPNQAQEDKLQRDIQLGNARRSAGSQNLQFRDIGSAIIGIDPLTGKEMSRLSKDINEKILNTAKGLYVYDPADPEGGRYVEGSAPTSKGSDLKPSERLSAKREARATYDDLPSKIDYFGKGQVQGSNQIKNRLDAVLKPVKGDFSKLNPQAKQTFVFAINKLRDPTSATLLAEANQIADKAGIGPRFSAFIANYKEGDPLPDQVAKDIYEVISQVESVHKENLINELIQLKNDTDEIGYNLTSIGVPKALQDEVIKRINNPSNAPVQSIPTAVKAQPKTTLSSPVNFGSESEARAAGFQSGDLVIIGGQTGNLE